MSFLQGVENRLAEAFGPRIRREILGSMANLQLTHAKSSDILCDSPISANEIDTNGWASGEIAAVMLVLLAVTDR